MNKKRKYLSENDFWQLDTDLYILMQKYFKISLNDDKKIFNWYCEIRNELEKQIVKQTGQNNENKNI
jgi:hypothetical protein